MQPMGGVLIIILMVLLVGTVFLCMVAQARLRRMRENIKLEKLRRECVIIRERAAAREALLGEQAEAQRQERDRIERAFFDEFRTAIPPHYTLAFAKLQARIDEKVGGINDHEEFDRVKKIVTDAGFFACDRKYDYFKFDRVLLKT